MIDLTTDHNPGDKYSGAGPYTHVKVTRVYRDDSAIKMLILEVAFGSDSGGNFLENVDKYNRAPVTILDADYDTYKALATNNPETIGAAEDRCREQCLIDLALYPGTIV